MKYIVRILYWGEQARSDSFFCRCFFFHYIYIHNVQYTLNLYRNTFHHKMVDWELWRHVCFWENSIVNICWIRLNYNKKGLFIRFVYFENVYDVECKYNTPDAKRENTEIVYGVEYTKNKIYINWDPITIRKMGGRYLVCENHIPKNIFLFSIYLYTSNS